MGARGSASRAGRTWARGSALHADEAAARESALRTDGAGARESALRADRAGEGTRIRRSGKKPRESVSGGWILERASWREYRRRRQRGPAESLPGAGGVWGMAGAAQCECEGVQRGAQRDANERADGEKEAREGTSVRLGWGTDGRGAERERRAGDGDRKLRREAWREAEWKEWFAKCGNDDRKREKRRGDREREMERERTGEGAGER